MRTNYYFFSDPKEIEFYSYRRKAIQQNIENSIYLSIAILFMYIIINSIWYVFDLSKNFPQEKYFSINLRAVTIVSIINILYQSIHQKFKFLQGKFIAQFIVILISLTLLTTSSINSYVISMNPRNNLTPILIGAIAITALFRFSLKESLFVYITGFLIFSSLFLIWKNTLLAYALNLSAVINIYILCFLVNRMLTRNAYRLHKQLQINESINTTLKSAIEQKDEVLAVVAHDLRNPINNVKQIAQLLSSPDHTEEDRKTLLPLIDQSCSDAESIINEIIEISKIKHTNQPIKTENLDEFIRNYYKQLVLKYPKRNINLNKKEGSKYSKIYLDKLQRVLDNLITNALKFTPEENLIEIKIYKENNYNIIEIIDEGIGIDEVERSKLFSRYNTSAKQGLKGEESIGLGLYIVKELVEMMNGSIEYMPNIKKGSIFKVMLPNA